MKKRKKNRVFRSMEEIYRAYPCLRPKPRQGGIIIITSAIRFFCIETNVEAVFNQLYQREVRGYYDNA